MFIDIQFNEIIILLIAGNSSNSTSPEVQVDSGNQRMLVPQSSGQISPSTAQVSPSVVQSSHAAPPSGQGARPKLRPLSQSNRRRYNQDQNGNVNNGKKTLEFLFFLFE